MHLEIIHILFEPTNRFAKNLIDSSGLHCVIEAIPSNAAEPDGISSIDLRMCSSQLCEIFCTIFHPLFLCGVVPDIWKSSCIVPVPKKNKVGITNDLRPVALTSVASKTCERIVLPQLRSFIHDSLEPIKFACLNNRSCEDAQKLL